MASDSPAADLVTESRPAAWWLAFRRWLRWTRAETPREAYLEAALRAAQDAAAESAADGAAELADAQSRLAAADQQVLTLQAEAKIHAVEIAQLTLLVATMERLTKSQLALYAAQQAGRLHQAALYSTAPESEQ
jgi:hypothetical protein